MSSGQSLRNGSSVEPGLPNTFLMPKARNRPKVACLTVTDLLLVFVGLRDDICDPRGKLKVIRLRHSVAMRSIEPGISRLRARAFSAPRNDVERVGSSLREAKRRKQSKLPPRLDLWIASLRWQ